MQSFYKSPGMSAAPPEKQPFPVLLTCPEVEGQDPLAFGLPARHLDVHLVHILLIRQGLVILVLGGLPRLPPPLYLGPPLPYLSSLVLQPLTSLLLDDACLHQGQEVPQPRMTRAHG